MLVPVIWLRELVSFSIDVDELAERLTLAGIEIDNVHRAGASDPLVVSGRVVACVEDVSRPGLHIVTVSIGAKGHITTITRAPNLTAEAIGRRVPVALEGATIFSDGNPSGLAVIQSVMSHGHESKAAILSARELGLGDDHTGILFLAETAEGEPVSPLFADHPQYGRGDVLELNILPNVARCLSMLGVAREVAAITAAGPVREPPRRRLPVNESGPPIGSAHRFDAELCGRLSTALIGGIEIAPSPEFVRRRLALAGLEPVNNVVDASNYVMLEIGQPTHVYDAALLPSLDIAVRAARRGETLQILGEEGKLIALPEGSPVIVADEQPVALAGVIGGKSSAISPATRRILLESANFSPVPIRKVQAATKLVTEASTRFSRGVDPALTLYAIERFVEILGATSESALVEWARDDTLGAEDVSQKIDLALTNVNGALGTQLDLATCHSLLLRLGFTCELSTEEQTLHVIVGSSRSDVREAADLIEEIARLYGYDRIPTTFPREPIIGLGRDKWQATRERTRDAMVDAGLREVLTYTMTSELVEARLLAGAPAESLAPHVRLLNPQSVERSVLRRSLLPELLVCAERNLRFRADCHIFEIGVVHLPERPGRDPKLPGQRWMLGLVMTGPVDPPSIHSPTIRDAGYFDATEALCTLFKRLAVANVKFEPTAQPTFQANACAAVICDDKQVGHVGLIHPLVARAFNLERVVAAAELDLELLLGVVGQPPVARDVSRFPPIEIDLSFVVSEELRAGDVLQTVRDAGKDEVTAASIFDIYRGGNIPVGRKAVGIRLLISSFSRTLTIDEGRAIAGRLAEVVRDRFGAELRT